MTTRVIIFACLALNLRAAAAVPVAATNLVIAWDLSSPADGVLVSYAGMQAADPGGTNEIEITGVPVGGAVRIAVQSFFFATNVTSFTTLGGQVIQQTNALNLSAADALDYYPPSIVGLRVSNNTALISFACTNGMIAQVQSSAWPSGPFTDTGEAFVGTGNTNATIILPLAGSQQFYRLEYLAP